MEKRENFFLVRRTKKAEIQQLGLAAAVVILIGRKKIVGTERHYHML